MTQAETRYGCFLPDLTGLARDLPIAGLPSRQYRPAPGPCKPLRANRPAAALAQLRIVTFIDRGLRGEPARNAGRAPGCPSSARWRPICT